MAFFAETLLQQGTSLHEGDYFTQKGDFLDSRNFVDGHNLSQAEDEQQAAQDEMTQKFLSEMNFGEDWEQSLPDNLRCFVEKGCDESVDYFKDEEAAAKPSESNQDAFRLRNFDIQFGHPKDGVSAEILVEPCPQVVKGLPLKVISGNIPRSATTGRAKTTFALAKSLDHLAKLGEGQTQLTPTESIRERSYFVKSQAYPKVNSIKDSSASSLLSKVTIGASKCRSGDKENYWQNGVSENEPDWHKEATMSPREHRALSEILEETSEWEGFKSSAQRMSFSRNPMSQRPSLAQILPSRKSDAGEIPDIDLPRPTQFSSCQVGSTPLDLKPHQDSGSATAGTHRPEHSTSKMTSLKSLVSETLLGAQQEGSALDGTIKGYHAEIKHLFNNLEKRLQGIVSSGTGTKKKIGLSKKPNLTKQPTEVHIPKSIVKRLEANEEHRVEFKRRNLIAENLAGCKESLKRLHSGRSKGNSRISNYFQSINLQQKPSFKHTHSGSRDMRSSGPASVIGNTPAQSHREFSSKLNEIWTSGLKSTSSRVKREVAEINHGLFHNSLNKSRTNDVSHLSEKSSVQELSNLTAPTFHSFLAASVKTPLKKKVSLGENISRLPPQLPSSRGGETRLHLGSQDYGLLSRLPKEISASDNTLAVYAASFKKSDKLHTPRLADKNNLTRRTFSICSSREGSTSLVRNGPEFSRPKSPQGYIQISEPAITLVEVQTSRPAIHSKKLKDFLNLEADAKAFRKIRDVNSRSDSINTSSRIINTSSTNIRMMPGVKTPDKSYLLKQDITSNSRCWLSARSPKGEPASKKTTTAQLVGLSDGIYNHNHTENRQRHSGARPPTTKASIKHIQAGMLR